jgi:hypothetical protein
MSDSEKPIEKEYAWKSEQETILKQWSEKALCYKMMHERSYKRFWCLNAWFNIPVIIISTITGTGNFASGSFPANLSFLIFVIGALNIFGGILATIATYTGVAQKLEGHRFSSISWDKFNRKLQIELSKVREDRSKAREFMKQSSEEYDRLMEMSPILPNDIIRWLADVIETGELESTTSECGLCCYECLCFPCGCNMCSCSCKTRDNEHNVDDSWRNIELPEVIGKIKPTIIAKEVEVKIDEGGDEYNIYKMS